MSEDFEEKIGEEDLGDGFTVKQGSDDADVIEPDESEVDILQDDPLAVIEEEDPEAAEMFSLMYQEYDER